MTEQEGVVGRSGVGPSRREVLAAAGVSGVAGLAGCLPDDGSSATTPTESSQFANYPVEDDTVTIGVSIPQTGVYQGEGDQLLAGYELAAQNINEGRGFVDNEHFEALAGSGGVLGKTLSIEVADTNSQAEGATESAQSLIDDEGAIVLTGGASSGEAIAHQSVARDRGVVHMIGFAPGNSISGADCALTGFQEMFNANVAATALQSVLVGEYGEDATFAQVSPNSNVGETFSTSMRSALTGAGWQEATAETTRVGTENFEPEIESATAEEPDVLVLNYYGLDGSYALSQAAEITDGTAVQDVVVPLYNRPMARSAGAAMANVLGTIHWESGIREQYSRMFTQAWTRAYSANERRATVPSGLAHLAYCQLFQYAAAVERAGSFEAPAVVDALEGYTYDVGMGSEELRECDHTASRPVPIVRGLPEDQRYFGKYYEIEQIVTDAGFSCDEAPATDCSFESF